MTLKFLGRKKGMTRLFDKDGNLVVCTVISAEPNIVSQLKSKESDGYSAVQLSAFKVKPSKLNNVSKAMKGHYAKANVEPRNKSQETRVEDSSQFQIGDEIKASQFAEVTFVDVTAISKGKGYQGVIKRHGFAGGPASHGSGFHRHGGSTGMRTSPGRCLPGQKKAGRMGADKVTTQNLKVVRVDDEKQVIVVQGAVPGSRGALVTVSSAKKKPAGKAKTKN